jgi:hypothetical protein
MLDSDYVSRIVASALALERTELNSTRRSLVLAPLLAVSSVVPFATRAQAGKLIRRKHPSLFLMRLSGVPGSRDFRLTAQQWPRCTAT